MVWYCSPVPRLVIAFHCDWLSGVTFVHNLIEVKSVGGIGQNDIFSWFLLVA